MKIEELATDAEAVSTEGNEGVNPVMVINSLMQANIKLLDRIESLEKRLKVVESLANI